MRHELTILHISSTLAYHLQIKPGNNFIQDSFDKIMKEEYVKYFYKTFYNISGIENTFVCTPEMGGEKLQL